jgi:hypothetical protein
VRKTLLALTLSLGFTLNASAIEIPTGLLRNEIDDVASILGFNTSTKFLSNPYPLGGYAGLEIGATLEMVNTEELKLLGNGNTSDEELRFTRISIGKGLFNNWDVFGHFVPYSKSNQISEFGALVKWAFFEGEYLPFTASAMVHLNTINIQDNYMNQSTGADLMLGVNVNRFALYFGGGYLRARSQLTQGLLDASVPLSPENTYKETFGTAHSFVGIHFEFMSMFLAGQIDRYEDPVYSLKLGTRL